MLTLPTHYLVTQRDREMLVRTMIDDASRMIGMSGALRT
jgi:hypothetical protein